MDGQQRLTTFIILLSCLLNFAKQHKLETLKSDTLDEIEKRYILRQSGDIRRAYLFGYDDDASFKYLKSSILDKENNGELGETFYTTKLKKAKEFFENCISDLFKENNENIKCIETLYQKLVNKLLFNVHDISDDFDVYVAFETMNNRGKQLSNLEILKNRLIYLTTIFDDKVLDTTERNILRKNINDAWKEIYKQIGRNPNFPLNDDEFLKAHWTLFFKYSRKRGSDYVNFLLNQHFTQKSVFGLETTRISEEINVLEDAEYDDGDEDDKSSPELNCVLLTPNDIKEYVKSLQEVSSYWYYSFNPKENKKLTEDEQLWIDRLDRIGMSYFRTIVVACMMDKKAKLKEKIELYKTIEKFIFLCFRMGKYQSSYYSSRGYILGRELFKKEKTISEITKIINEEFNKNIDKSTHFFYELMKANFEQSLGYYSWNYLKYFLFEYESYLSSENSSKKILDWNMFLKTPKDKISVEHIYPQVHDSVYWETEFKNYNEEEKNCFCGSLGNLLPLSTAINSSLQNSDFNTKKTKRYRVGSQSEIEVSLNEHRGSNEIKIRGEKLLSFMEQRWGFKFPESINRLDLLGIPFYTDNSSKTSEVESQERD